MNNIKDKEVLYFKEALDAIITKTTMIPGLHGQKVNIKKSYKKMKTLNEFNESLLVFDNITPSKSIKGLFDKIILSGNPSLKQISIILDIDDAKAFYNINSLLQNQNVIVDVLTKQKYDLNNTNYQSIITENYYSFTNFCLSYNLSIDKQCPTNYLYTILGYKVTSPYLTNLKQVLGNGKIYILELNESNYNEITILIKYLKNNNYQIVPINTLITE